MILKNPVIGCVENTYSNFAGVLDQIIELVKNIDEFKTDSGELKKI